MTTTPLLASIAWDDFFKNNSAVESPIAFKEDPVVLACAAYRTWQETPHLRWADFNTVTVQPQDRTQAELVRTYYRDRIMIDTLKNSNTGRPISRFRQTLYSILNNNCKITQSEIGLLHRLPYFYAEDTALDRVMLLTKSVPNREAARQSGEQIQSRFTLIERVLRSASPGESVQFWFGCDLDSAPYCLTVQASNPLLGLLDSLVQKPVDLQAQVWCKVHRGHYRDRAYYSLNNVVPWSL